MYLKLDIGWQDDMSMPRLLQKLNLDFPWLIKQTMWIKE